MSCSTRPPPAACESDSKAEYAAVKDCPKPELSKREKTAKELQRNEGFMAMMEMLKCNQCKDSAGGAVSFNPPMLGGFKSSQGCEQIQVMQELHTAMVSNVKCSFQRMQACSSTCGSASQQMKVKIDRSKFKKDTKITQESKITLVTGQQFTETAVSEMDSSMQNTAQTAVDTMMDSKTGFMGSEASQKLLSSMQSYVNNDTFSKSVSDSIADVQASIDTKQIMDIEISRSTFDGNLEITQSSYCTLLATQVVNKVFEEMMKTDFYQEFLTDIDADFKSEGGGVEGIFGMFMIIVAIGAAIFLGGFKLLDNVTGGGNYKGPLAVAVGGVVVGLILWLFGYDTMGWIVGGLALAIALFMLVKPMMSKDKTSSTEAASASVKQE